MLTAPDPERARSEGAARVGVGGGLPRHRGVAVVREKRVAATVGGDLGVIVRLTVACVTPPVAVRGVVARTSSTQVARSPGVDAAGARLDEGGGADADERRVGLRLAGRASR